MGNSLANCSDKGFAEGDRAQTLVCAKPPPSLVTGEVPERAEGADVSAIQRQEDQQKAFSLAEKVGNSLANWSDKGFAEGDRTQALVYALFPSP